jgi:hypothetical protein
MANEMISTTGTEILPQKKAQGGGQLSVFSNAESFNLATRMATALAQSTVVPKAYQGNVGNCMIAIEMASRINTSPMMVMQNLYIVNGNPAWSSQWIIAMINSSKRYKTELQFEFGHAKEDGGLSCKAWAEDYSGHKVEGPKITMKMAQDEGWSTKSGSKWKTMPEVMIRYRAASFFGRMNCPDMIMGIYSQEEVIDMGDSYTGPIATQFITNPETGEVIEGPKEDPAISQDQRQSLFRLAKEHLGENANEILKGLISEQGYESTNGMPVSVYNKIVGEIMELAEARKAGEAEPEEKEQEKEDTPAE